ncbi:hypothetical protein CPB97_004412 [Podila verticillata]|nr:hypothetical protein CPB97_004412 [Podila verticillata]
MDLRSYCGARIIRSLNLLNALEILFDITYRYEDVKDAAQSRWQVTLTRVYDLLKIDVKGLELNGMSIINEYMHIIPMSGSKPIITYVNPQILRSYRAVSGKTIRDSTGSRQT